MTHEEKQLLFKDLCARLPYGVILHVEDDSGNILDEELNNIDSLCEEINIGYHFFSDVIQPYLRHPKSMTTEERLEYARLCDEFKNGNLCGVYHFLNAHHIDYNTDEKGCGLIEKGLALEAPEGMYNLEY